MRDYVNYNKKTLLLRKSNDVKNTSLKRQNFRNKIWAKMNCYVEVSQFIFQMILLRKKFFKTHYDDSLLNHFARARIKNAIRKKYFWLSMLFEIYEYVRICSDCQRVRVYHHKSYNKFNFILSSGVHDHFTQWSWTL